MAQRDFRNIWRTPRSRPAPPTAIPRTASVSRCSQPMPLGLPSVSSSPLQETCMCRVRTAAGRCNSGHHPLFILLSNIPDITPLITEWFSQAACSRLPMESRPIAAGITGWRIRTTIASRNSAAAVRILPKRPWPIMHLPPKQSPSMPTITSGPRTHTAMYGSSTTMATVWQNLHTYGDVWKFDDNGNSLAEFTNFGGQISNAAAMTIDSSGNLWITDTGNNRVVEINSSGVLVKTIGAPGAGDGEFSQPSGIGLDASGDVWVVDSGNDRVQEFSSSGTWKKNVGSAGSGNGEFNDLQGICFNSARTLFWVTD